MCDENSAGAMSLFRALNSFEACPIIEFERPMASARPTSDVKCNMLESITHAVFTDAIGERKVLARAVISTAKKCSQIISKNSKCAKDDSRRSKMIPDDPI